MDPQAELDQALTSRLRGSTAPYSTELEPLLQVAEQLRSGSGMPSPEFTAALQARIVARTQQLAADRQHVTETLPLPARLQTSGPIRRPDSTRPTPLRRLRTLPAAAVLAASLVIVIGSTIAFAAGAAPGSSLYGLRRLEQGVRSQLSPDAVSKARLHLSYARDALASLNTADVQGNDGAYREALNTLASEAQAAESAAAQVPAGADRDALNADLTSFRAQATTDLRAALPRLSWLARATTTTVLGQFGVPIPQVSKARVVTVHSTSSSHGTSSKVLRIVVDGSGFLPGAVILLDGHPVGTMISVTPSEATAQLTSADSIHGDGHSIGIGNPNGMAAYSTKYDTTDEQDDSGSSGNPNGDQETPVVSPTPTPDPHSGGHH